MNIKCILFDADGVMINSEKFSIQYQKKFDVTNKEMLLFFNSIFQDCIIGKADLKKAIVPYLANWKWNGTVDELLQFWFKSEHKINKKIIPLIKHLRKRNIKCCLATNQEKYRTQYMKEKMGFSDIFDAIYSSAEIGYKKPKHKFYKFIFDDLNKNKNIDKKQILYIDNTSSAIKAAKKFGFNTHIYTDNDKFERMIKPLLK